MPPRGETQKSFARIWIQLIEFISYDDNRYDKRAPSDQIHLCVFTQIRHVLTSNPATGGGVSLLGSLGGWVLYVFYEYYILKIDMSLCGGLVS